MTTQINKIKEQIIKKEKELEKHLPTYAELKFLRNSNKYKNLLKLNNGLEFVKQEDEIAKRNNYIIWFTSYSDRADLYCYSDRSYSDADLGARFVRMKINRESK